MSLYYNMLRRTLKRFLVLVLSFLFWDSGQAFFVDPSIEILEKKVHIQVNSSDSMQVDIYEKLENTANQYKDIIFTEALSATAQDIQFFVESEGREFNLLQGQDRLTTLADLAEEFQEPVFFRMGTENFGTLFKSQEVTIPAKEIKHLKLSFRVDLDFINDFYFSEIFLDNNQEIKDFELVLNLETEDACKHFLNNSSQNALFEDAEYQKTILWSERDFTPSENFKFFWSSVENPVMQFPYQGYLYEGYFVSPPALKKIEKVTILIDKSGSLFGAPWERVQEWLQFLLQDFVEDPELTEREEESEVKIGFLGEEIEWYGEQGQGTGDEGQKTEGENEELEIQNSKNKYFYKNDFEFRKDFFKFFDQIKPVGKVDLDKVLEVVQENIVPDDNQVIILITDEDQTTNYKLQTTNIEIPIVLLSFTGDEFSPLAVQARWSGGFFQKLFKNADGLLEKDEFLTKWNNQLSSFRYPEEADKEILPLEFREASGKEERFFVGRQSINTNVTHAKAFSFLPRLWGKRRLAEIFSNLMNKSSNSIKEFELGDTIDAILSLGRTFGIKTDFFTEKTTRTELQKKLTYLTPLLLKPVILDLESPFLFFSDEKVRFYGATPLYRDWTHSTRSAGSGFATGSGQARDIWRSFDYYDRVRPETLLEIAPFSPAQKELFLLFPDILATGFGIGTEVDFCTEFRCLSLRKGYRKEPLPTDRILFKHYDPYHWANEYLILAIKEGLFQPGQQGELQPEKGVNRAELARLIYLLQKK